MEDKATQPLTVTIRTREKILFQGKVTGVTSTNERGEFDVLSGHENFISVVKERLLIHNSEQSFTFTTGILRVEENAVTVYIGITNPEKIKNAHRELQKQKRRSLLSFLLNPKQP